MRFMDAESYSPARWRIHAGAARGARSPTGSMSSPMIPSDPITTSGICQSQLWVTPKAMELLIACSAMHGYSEPVFQ